jgi:hypothetical protein
MGGVTGPAAVLLLGRFVPVRDLLLCAKYLFVAAKTVRVLIKSQLSGDRG